jgi:hypothetical protein
MADLDRCPTCGRRITDTDDAGCEAADGQRWCIAHVPTVSTNLIDTILARITANNGPHTTDFYDAIQSGRREAYEDVLRLLGFYDDELEPRYKKLARSLGDYDDPPTCPVCDGIHGTLCPIESPDPGYYADEMRAGR